MDPSAIAGRPSKDLADALHESWDLVIVMTDAMKGEVATVARDSGRAPLELITLHELAGEKGDVPDPKSKSPQVYLAAATEIKRLLEEGWSSLGASS